jgi:histidinol phosphatase-like PHP family hydrolase
MVPMYNLHNHTPFSDGAYTIDELCEAHLKLGFPVAGIGLSDHLFATPSSREVRNEKEFDRVFGKEARSYVAAVKEARQRWAGKLRILCGCEINWPLNKGQLELVRGMLNGIDYVLFEFVDWAGLTTLANQARRWPCPVGLAHCDVRTQFPNTSLDQIVRTLANARIFYEVSSKLVPLEEHEPWFKVVPNHRVLVTIGTDTHDDLDILKLMPEMYEYVLAHGLEPKLLVPNVREEAAPAVAGVTAARSA